MPLPTPIASRSAMPLDSWHMFEQSGKLFVPNCAREQLVQERRLVARAARRVEHAPRRGAERAQLARDQRERVVPARSAGSASLPAEHHRLREAALLAELVVATAAQLVDAVRARTTRASRARSSPPRRAPSRRSRRTRTPDRSAAAGSGHAQPGQSKPPGWFICSRARLPRARPGPAAMAASVAVTALAPPAARGGGLTRRWPSPLSSSSSWRALTRRPGRRPGRRRGRRRYRR